MDAHAADEVLTLDQRDALAELGGIERRLLPGGAGANHHKIVKNLGHSDGCIGGNG